MQARKSQSTAKPCSKAAISATAIGISPSMMRDSVQDIFTDTSRFELRVPSILREESMCSCLETTIAAITGIRCFT